MRKVLSTIICAGLLSITTPRPAISGLMIDPAAIAQNFSGTVQTIFDMTVQNILQNGMLKQLQTQGFSLASIKTLATSQLGKYASGLVKRGIMKAQVKSTKGKEEELLTKERDLYASAAKANAEAKWKIAQADRDETEKQLSEKQRQLPEKEQELKNAQAVYEQTYEDSEKAASASENLGKAQSEYEKAVNDVEELKAQLQAKNENLKLMEAEKSTVGTEKDPKWQNMNKRAKTIQEEKDDVGTIIKTEIDDRSDWGKLEGTRGFDIDDKTYREFIEAYFYEPSAGIYTDLHQGKALQDKQQELEAKKDKILRQRKYLVVNTAAHLLQVSATIRREKPLRESIVKKWFDESKEEADEINAMTAYSNTRIENSRALLLYARLLAAKMQYNAAKEINGFDLEKIGRIEDNNYSVLDLGKYILTQKELDEAVKNSKSSKVIDGISKAAIGE